MLKSKLVWVPLLLLVGVIVGGWLFPRQLETIREVITQQPAAEPATGSPSNFDEVGTGGIAEGWATGVICGSSTCPTGSTSSSATSSSSWQNKTGATTTVQYAEMGLTRRASSTMQYFAATSTTGFVPDYQASPAVNIIKGEIATSTQTLLSNINAPAGIVNLSGTTTVMVGPSEYVIFFREAQDNSRKCTGSDGPTAGRVCESATSTNAGDVRWKLKYNYVNTN